MQLFWIYLENTKTIVLNCGLRTSEKMKLCKKPSIFEGFFMFSNIYEDREFLIKSAENC